jgi:pyruvyl transferase EpsO
MVGDITVAGAGMDKTTTSHADVMARLVEKHTILSALIDKRPLHYIGAPLHSNIGDLLIMHGTLSFFERWNLRPKSIVMESASSEVQLSPEDVVLFHGGGNFGNLYPDGQKMRERMLAAWPSNRMICLPQSICFASSEDRARSASVFRQHKDVHICVRDEVSYEQAKEFSDHVYLLPDMAHSLYPVRSPTQPTRDTLVLKRTDGESCDEMIDGANLATVTDWPDLIGRRESAISLADKLIKYSAILGRGRASNGLILGPWLRYSNRIVGEAIELFASHERIITDRLHGHILACLMDKPNVSLDNNYGKNSSYVAAWTKSSPLVTSKPMPQKHSSV